MAVPGAIPDASVRTKQNLRKTTAPAPVNLAPSLSEPSPSAPLLSPQNPPQNAMLADALQNLRPADFAPSAPKAQVVQAVGQHAPSALPGDFPATEAVDPQRLGRISATDWRDLQIMVNNCRACPLGESRQHAVFGAGHPKGAWLFVGEAPGAEEDRRGEAFVGRGGQLLDNMLKAIGLTREQDVYIANILKCRPPNNRDPLGPEVHSCLPFLQRQIALLQPRIIVALGRFAAQGLLQVTTPIGQLRGNVHQYQGIPLVVTYHPAYLLRSPLEKRKAWEDLQLAMQVYCGQVSKDRSVAVTHE